VRARAGQAAAAPEPPLAGVALVLALVPLTAMGAVLGTISAFLVPVGFRLGGGVPSVGGANVTTPGGTSALPPLVGAAHPMAVHPMAVHPMAVHPMAVHPLAAADGGAGGVPISLGVGLAFLGCLGLAALARVCTGERLAALAPITGWLVIAVLANMPIHGGLVLPAVLEPGLLFLYAGVVGGCLGLLPQAVLELMRPIRRARSGQRSHPAATTAP